MVPTCSTIEVRAESVDNLPSGEVADRIAGHILAPILQSCAITSLKELTDPHANGMPYRMLMPLADEQSVAAALSDPIRLAAAAMRQPIKVPA